MMRNLYIILSLVCTTLIVGCVSGPQQINVNPHIELAADSFAKNHPIWVVVKDMRDDPLLGTRGGVHPEADLISIDNDLKEAINQATRDALKRLGFVVDDDPAQPFKFTVLIEKLTYNISGKRIATDVELYSAVQFVAENQGHKFTGRYNTKTQRKFFTTPSKQKNTEFINQVLSDTLSRGFKDDGLLTFLRKQVNML